MILWHQTRCALKLTKQQWTSQARQAVLTYTDRFLRMLCMHPLHVQEGPRARGPSISLETSQPSHLPEGRRSPPREHREIETEDAAGPACSPGADAHADIEPSPATAGMRRRTGKVHADSQAPTLAPGLGVHASHGTVQDEAGACSSAGLPSSALQDAPDSQPAQHGASTGAGVHA